MDTELPSLLAAGERAAFHGPPAAAVNALEQAIMLAREQGRRAEVTAAAWLLGVALEAGGRYGAALTVLGPLVDAADANQEPETLLFAALAAATIASLHRQLGRHEAAREFDEHGRALAGDSAEALFDCEVGLSADAVGLADLEAARAHLAAAQALVERREDEWWQQRVRLDWARAEAALLAEQPEEAVAAAVTAVERAERARAPRHVAKGLLFQGVGELQAGQDEAAGTLRRAATLAESLGALPLVWQSRALLGALLAGRDPGESARSLAAARSAVLAIAGDLPTDLCEEWLARPNVSALLEG